MATRSARKKRKIEVPNVPEPVNNQFYYQAKNFYRKVDCRWKRLKICVVKLLVTVSLKSKHTLVYMYIYICIYMDTLILYDCSL